MAIAGIDVAEDSKTNGTIWIFSESFDAQLDGIQAHFEAYIKPDQIIGNIQKVRGKIWNRFTYRNKKGYLIDFAFKTYEQGRAKVQSAKLLAALLDEEPPEDIYDEIYTRCIDLQAPIFLAFTPLKGMTWSYDAIWLASKKDPNIRAWNWGMADNTFISRKEIEMCKQRWSAKKCRMRLYGLYTGAEDAVIENFDRDKHLKTGLYDPEQPVYVCVDWGVRFAAILFAQVAKVTRKDGTVYNEIRVFEGCELYGAGYGHVMEYIINKPYQYVGYFCDPAGNARSAATKSGVSLLSKIKEFYGITFTYIKRLGIEEGIDFVEGKLENALGEVSLYIDKNVSWTDPEGKAGSLSDRIENYVRDKKSRQPIKDGINDHMCDTLRYLIANIDKDNHKRRIRHH